MPVELLVAVIAVFVAVALLTGMAASSLLSRPVIARRRLGSLVPAPGSTENLSSAPLTSGLDPVLARWSMILPKSAKEMSALERRLASGGYRSPWALVIFRASVFLLPVLLGVAVLGGFGMYSRTGWLVAAFSAALGYMAPDFVLGYKVAQRRKQIRNGLPDVLDLLIVCLEAGSSLDQAVAKASEELAIAYPALSEELHILTTETRAGKSRIEAFRNFAERTRVDAARALVAMLIQTDRFGTSVAQALRTMADDMRTRRRQAAEETAAKVGIKLVFPLVFFMFPALYVVILGPAAIKIIEMFSRQQQ